MQHLRKEYDFLLNFTRYNDLSCTQFVYESCRNLMSSYDVYLKTRYVGVLRKRILVPDDFITDKFKIVWKSLSVSDQRLESILKKNRRYQQTATT